MDDLLIIVSSWMLVLIVTWGESELYGRRVLGPGRARVVIFLNSGGYGEQSILQFEAEVNQIIAHRRESNSGLLISCTDSCRLQKTAAGIQEPTVSPIALHTQPTTSCAGRLSVDETVVVAKATG
jgi:hypothetical protein